MVTSYRPDNQKTTIFLHSYPLAQQTIGHTQILGAIKVTSQLFCFRTNLLQNKTIDSLTSNFNTTEYLLKWLRLLTASLVIDN